MARQNVLTVVGLLLVLVIGLLVRLDDLQGWQAHPERVFFKGEPVLANFDGYYYLNTADDLLEEAKVRTDKKRCASAFAAPLLSVLAVAIVNHTPFSLNWVGVMLPAFLGGLLALPVFALGSFFGGQAMGLSSALFSVLFPYYVFRTTIGLLDTDCLNVTWAVSITYLLLRFGVEVGRRRYCYLLGSVIVYLLFVWWYHLYSVTAMFVLPLAVALAFFYRPSRREGFIFGGSICVVIFLFLYWKGPDLPLGIFRKIMEYFQRLYKLNEMTTGNFPNSFNIIGENERPTFNDIVSYSTASMPGFLVSCLGFLGLIWRRPKEALFLLMLLALAVFSFFFAQRFLIYMAPIVALGVGFVIAELWQRRHQFKSAAFLAPVLLLVLAWPAFSKTTAKTSWPNVPAQSIAGMALVAEATPENAVIWAPADNGYPMMYWSGRDVLIHGGFYGASIGDEQLLYVGMPLAMDDEQLAANFIRFFVKHGMNGMHVVYGAMNGDIAQGLALVKKICAAGPDRARQLIDAAGLQPVGQMQKTEEWLRFFFPVETRPTYLFLDKRSCVVSYWWFQQGTWDIKLKRGQESAYELFLEVNGDDELLQGRIGKIFAEIDLAKGLVKTWARPGSAPDQVVNLSRMVTYNGEKERIKDYGHDLGLRFEIYEPGRYAVLMNKPISNSVFNKLFLRHTYDPAYFRPVALKAPDYQLWEVVGDRM